MKRNIHQQNSRFTIFEVSYSTGVAPELEKNLKFASNWIYLEENALVRGWTQFIQNMKISETITNIRKDAYLNSVLRHSEYSIIISPPRN